MIKKVMASAAMAASVVGVPAATAPQAQAIGTDTGTAAAEGDGAAPESGAPAVPGDLRTRTDLLRGSLRAPRVGTPSGAGTGSVVGLVPSGALRDRPLLPALPGPPAPPRADAPALSGNTAGTD